MQSNITKRIKYIYFKLVNFLSFNLIQKQNIIISNSNKLYLELNDDFIYLESKIEGHRELNQDLQERINLLENIIRAKEKTINELRDNDYGAKCDSVNNWLMRNIQKAGDN